MRKITVATVTIALMTTAMLVAGPAVAVPAASTANANLTSAANYLVATRGANGLTGGTNLRHNGYYESFDKFADFGLTIDGAFALAATRTDNAVLARIVKFFNTQHTDGSKRSINDWTGIGTTSAGGGSLGKEALLTEVTGYDPHAFGGHDLIAALDKSVCTKASKAPSTACVAAGNYRYSSSTFAQALGIIAQLRAGDTSNAAAPITYLEGLQHSNGSFSSLIPDAGDDDVDSTSMAATALALLPDDATAEADVTKAIDWIASQQETTGGFPGVSGDSTNSTALAVQGLVLAGTKYSAVIEKARSFLAAEQNSDGGFNVAAGGQQGSDVRASTQAVGGVVGTSFGTLTDDIAPPSTRTANARAAAKYLVGNLTKGTRLQFSGGYGPNYGGSADLAFALASLGTQNYSLVNVTRYLRRHVASYADPKGKASSFPGPYSGAVAKFALLAEITDQNPKDFGGYNLIHTLLTHICAKADTSGACTARGDFYQAFSSVSQALAVMALARAHVSVPATVVTRLKQLQCRNGGFSSTLIAPGSACTSDVDTTGYAVQALVLVPSAKKSVAKAITYLRAAQQADGGWTGASGENSNSTALALQALLAAPKSDFTPKASFTAEVVRRSTAVTAGQSWLADRQNSNGGLGVSPATPASDVSATAQAVPAIRSDTLTTLEHAIKLPGGRNGGGGSTAGHHTSLR